jgi:hypothetical protein
MIVLQIVGILTIGLLFIYGIILFIAPCPVDHDTIARQGANECPKCKEEL